MIIIGNDATKTSQLKKRVHNHIQTKDLESLKYFFGIEVTQSKEGTIISKRKYALYIQQETCMIDYRPMDSLVDPNQKLMAEVSPSQT